MRWIVACFTCLSFVASARAQTTSTDPTVDVQLFHPAPGGNDLFTVQSADVNSHLGLSLGVNLNYARNPLAIEVLQANGTQESVGLMVKNRLDANVLLAFGLFNIADIGVVMPFVYQGGFEGTKLDAENIALGAAPKTFTQGDLRVMPRIRFLHLAGGKFSAAIVGTLVVPTAKQAPLASEPAMVITPGVALSARGERARVAFNASYAIRNTPTSLLDTLKVDDQYLASFGVGFMVNNNPDRPIELIGEVFGLTSADDPLGMKAKGDEKKLAKVATSLEGEIGLRIALAEMLRLTVGGGGGILPGYGAPSPRVFAALAFYNGDTGVPDADRDGVADEFDKCPEKPEDKDGFQDTDGCPDGDNDNDGITDEDDECPDQAGPASNNGCPLKDKDGDGILNDADKCPDQPGPQENLGCPDVDGDGDGVPDRLDKCPKEAEDKDGFEDEDGCPELDNDKDGMADLNDICPSAPEDKDTYQDDDGCPDLDNDNDGIPDKDDKCPLKAEDYNGIDDKDGCPDGKAFKTLVEVTKEKIEIKDKVFFKTGSATILPKSFPLLDQVAAVLKGYKNLSKVRIEGHTDAAGSRKKNVTLSRDRAESVKSYLVRKGVDGGRLVAEGYGPDKPIASNKSAKGKEMNRRVEFVILEQTPVGGDVSVAPKAPPPAPKPPPAPEGGAVPGATPPPGGDMPLFEIGPEPAAAPAPAAEPETKVKKKGKAAKKKADKKADEPQIDFNF